MAMAKFQRPMACPFHSSRKASIGSTLVAFRAGRYPAARAVADRTTATASGITTTARSFMRKILWKAHWNSNPDLLFRREPSFPLYDGPVGVPGQTRTGILQLR